MDRLDFLANRLNVDVRARAMPTPACLTRRPGLPAQLSYSTGLDAASQRLPAVATLLHVEALAWPGVHFRLRLPLAEDDPALRRRAAREWRDYRIPYRLALRTLMPDAWLDEMAREEADPRHAAALAGVGLEDLERRVEEWRAARPAPPLPPADLGPYLARGALKRGLDKPSARPPRGAGIRAIQRAWEAREGEPPSADPPR